jgi:hypothetical protein
MHRGSLRTFSLFVQPHLLFFFLDLWRFIGIFATFAVDTDNHSASLAFTVVIDQVNKKIALSTEK